MSELLLGNEEGGGGVVCAWKEGSNRTKGNNIDYWIWWQMVARWRERRRVGCCLMFGCLGKGVVQCW